ncbi:MAG TPA: clostripain-related cysteine peptidase [Pyrinomonadaceae bacterium]|jgi:hypothetical protein|nr:clostripain-related cysteine peptidase [Pyrinomonadaceae bacterium]
MSVRIIRLPTLLLILAGTIAIYGQGLASRARSRPLPPRAEWTVMIFMDGDNNLEEDSLIDFMEIARVGSTDRVNVVVQLDRIGKYVTRDDERYPFWTQTLRFYMTKGITPSPDNTPKEYDIGEANMGDGQTLADFVSWAKTTFPARRYALIISDHGQGWRGTVSPTDDVRALVSGSGGDLLTQPWVGNMIAAFPFRTALGSPYRTISFDETNKDKLYNREVQDSLLKELKGEKLDLIGFDACLMAMVETGYAMRGVAAVFVGSEELEPGTGWQYDNWLGTLTRNPTMDGPSLGKALVESYQKRYGTAEGDREPNLKTTLSLTDLKAMDALADSISALSKSLISKFGAEKENIKAARDACAVYAPNALGDGRDYFYHVDLARFCEQLLRHTQDREIRQRASAVLGIVKAAVLDNYAGTARQGVYGSNGLAIYFPPSGSAYKDDWLSERGYDNSRTLASGEKAPDFPVEFVERHYWADFLHVYFKNFP